jgi:hypothetical protein
VTSVAKGRSVASSVSSFGSVSMASYQNRLISVQLATVSSRGRLIRFELVNVLDQVQKRVVRFDVTSRGRSRANQ